MRTRDVFVSSDFSELNQLFLHLESGTPPQAFWWRSQVISWCCTSAITEHGDMRIHVASFIDRLFELDWNDERLGRLFDQYMFTFKLPTDVALSEFLADAQGLIRADLTLRPMSTRREPPRHKTTRLHTLLEDKSVWDDTTWFQAQRYLLDHFTRLGMELFVILAGCDPSGEASYFKTDAVRLLRDLPPTEMLRAWEVWRR